MPIERPQHLMSVGNFYTDEKIELLIKLSDHLKDKDTDSLKTLLTEIHQHPINKFRIMLTAISFELSNRGIAPRWQGVLQCAATEAEYKIIAARRRSDAIILDLYWLCKEFPGHQPVNDRWAKLFTSGFDMKLAVSIADRQTSRSNKTEEISTNIYQQFGCIALYSNESKVIRMKAKKESKDGRLKRSTKPNTKSIDDHNLNRVHIIYCAKLADCSPTKTAAVSRWITGDNRTRQSVQNLIKKYNIKKIHKHTI